MNKGEKRENQVLEQTEKSSGEFQNEAMTKLAEEAKKNLGMKEEITAADTAKISNTQKEILGMRENKEMANNLLGQLKNRYRAFGNPADYDKTKLAKLAVFMKIINDAEVEVAELKKALKSGNLPERTVVTKKLFGLLGKKEELVKMTEEEAAGDIAYQEKVSNICEKNLMSMVGNKEYTKHPLTENFGSITRNFGFDKKEYAEFADVSEEITGEPGVKWINDDIKSFNYHEKANARSFTSVGS